MCYMESVGVREIRQNISVYLRRVERGEAFTVTDHGRPVALLSPLPPDNDRLAELVAAGVLEPRKPRGPLPEPQRWNLSVQLSDEISRLRDEDAP